VTLFIYWILFIFSFYPHHASGSLEFLSHQSLIQTVLFQHGISGIFYFHILVIEGLISCMAAITAHTRLQPSRNEYITHFLFC